MRRIRAVAFDLWGTLVTDTDDLWEHRIAVRARRMQAGLRAHGLDASFDDVRAAYRHAWQASEAIRARGLDVRNREQLHFFLDALDPTFRKGLLPEMEERLGDEYAEGLTLWPPDAIPGAREALEWCREQGLRTALVSNTGQTPGRVLRRTLNALGLAELIDVWVFSDEVGLSKPYPAIFRHTAGALGVQPGEVLFVGDTPGLDVIGAQAAGMPVLQVGRKPDLGRPADYRLPDLRGFGAAVRAMGLQPEGHARR